MTVKRVPPPLAADERTTLEAFLDHARGTVVTACAGAPDDACATLTGIVFHLCWMEEAWFDVALLGEKSCTPQDGSRHPDVPLALLLSDYQAQCELSRKIVRALSLDTAVARDGRLYSVRWILFHLFEETARQLGRIDAVRATVRR